MDGSAKVQLVGYSVKISNLFFTNSKNSQICAKYCKKISKLW